MLPDVNQNQIFLSSESDRYFQRNASANSAYDYATDRVAQMLSQGVLDGRIRYPESIADFGCSSGERLSALCARYGITGANGLGVDASEAAIEAARERDPDLFWAHADWTSRQFVDSGYDVVITSFAWHWIDRHMLMDALCMVHHHVNDGGVIIINDFDSVADVPYAHRDGVMTYKRQVPPMFLATKLYEMVAFERYDYPGTDVGEDPCVCAVLRRVE
jgi:SAM-dependent methyltransferase